MTMYRTRVEPFRESEWEFRQGVWPKTFEGLVNRVRIYSLAVQPRGYLWFPLTKGLISLHLADTVLAEIHKPHWDCWRFPRTWLREDPPSLITETNVRVFVLPERLRLLPSFPEEWCDQD